jgi:hypothetical protein
MGGRSKTRGNADSQFFIKVGGKSGKGGWLLWNDLTIINHLHSGLSKSGTVPDSRWSWKDLFGNHVEK